MAPTIIQLPEAEIAGAFVSWLSTQGAVRLVVVEGYPGSGKSHLLRQLPTSWGCLEVDCVVGENHPGNVPWLELAREAGVEKMAGELLETHDVVVVEGPVAWPLLSSLTAKLGPAARRISVQHWPTSGGVAYWTDGLLRQLSIDNANTEFWRSIMLYHATEPERDADLIVQRLSAELTPESVFEEMKA